MSVRHTVLGLLCSAPMHGYKLRQVAQSRSWMFPMANASMYPSLHELERDGFVVHDSEVHDGRARKVYRVTEAGRIEMQRWLKDPPESNSTQRDPLLLKVSMLSRGEHPRAQAWINESMSDIRDEIGQNRSALESATLDDYNRLAMEYRTDVLLARLQFLERTSRLGADFDSGAL